MVLLVDQGLVGALGLSARDAARLVSAVEGLGLDVEALHLRGHTVTEACPVACLRLSEGARRMVTEAGVRHADLWEYETRRPTLHQVGTAGEVRDLLWTGFVAGRPVEMAELFAAVGAMQTGRGSRAGNERKGRQ
ncbi:hypothetical protein [Actinomadura oligospora]|uniref:hypothetical protein n=1 Tax=Actinomadura oligospora TaxID=111804 RepID=UPI0012FC8132|nr:hypothetical protein [Actinomadura oligospora]